MPIKIDVSYRVRTIKNIHEVLLAATKSVNKKSPDLHRGFFFRMRSNYFFGLTVAGAAGAAVAGAAAAVAGLGVIPIFFNTISEMLASVG